MNEEYLGWYECQDRVDIITNNIQDYLLKHPIIKVDKTPEGKAIKAKLNKVQKLLGEVYQDIGNKF